MWVGGLGEGHVFDKCAAGHIRSKHGVFILAPFELHTALEAFFGFGITHVAWLMPVHTAMNAVVAPKTCTLQRQRGPQLLPSHTFAI